MWIFAIWRIHVFKIIYIIYRVLSLKCFQVVTANIYDADSMVTHFQGQDAVLSCLGCPPSYFSLRTITFYTDTAKHIVAALRKAAVKRFVFMSSWYTKCMGYYVLENIIVRTCVRSCVCECLCVCTCVRTCVRECGLYMCIYMLMVIRVFLFRYLKRVINESNT